MTAKDQIRASSSFLWSNKEALTLAFVWVLFLVFFTYTTLVVEIFKANGDFSKVFFTEQSKYVALFVNIGIVVMLLFDNHTANKPLMGVWYYVPFLAICMCIFILAHSNLASKDALDRYIEPISNKSLSILTYIVFVIVVYVLKARSLCNVADVKKSL